MFNTKIWESNVKVGFVSIQTHRANLVGFGSRKTITQRKIPLSESKMSMRPPLISPYLQYSSAHAVRMVVQEFIWKAQHFSQPIHHIHFQFCTGWTGGLGKSKKENQAVIHPANTRVQRLE